MVNVSVVSATIRDLASLAVLKDDLGISSTDSSEDAKLRRFLTVASQIAESYVERSLVKDLVTEKVAGDGSVLMQLDRYPVKSVVSVSLDGSTIGSTEFSIQDPSAGVLYKEGTWTGTLHWRHNIERFHLSGEEKLDWLITYRAGYDPYDNTTASSLTTASPDVPHDLSFAVRQLASINYYDVGQNPAVRSQRIGEASETRFDISKTGSTFPPTIQAILDKYRRVV